MVLCIYKYFEVIPQDQERRARTENARVMDKRTGDE